MRDGCGIHGTGAAGTFLLVVGNGPSEGNVEDIFPGAKTEPAYSSRGFSAGSGPGGCVSPMDVFAFASKSETQGIVIAEAMAAGVPVVALDAPGVREVVDDGENGFLLSGEDRKIRVRLGTEYCALREEEREQLSRNAIPEKGIPFSERMLH